MSDNDSPRPSPDPEATALLLKKQLVHLRRWFERERWKIEPQQRSFAPIGDTGQDAPHADDRPEVKPRGRAAGSPEGPAGSRS